MMMNGSSTIGVSGTSPAVRVPIVRRDKDSIVEQNCSVCGSLTKEFHFGAVCCVACGAFFRRAVSEGRLFTCRNGGGCTIGGNGRATCRYCRYQKCISVGMDPQAVQPSRGAIGKREAKENQDVTLEQMNQSISLFETKEVICSNNWTNNSVENILAAYNALRDMRKLIYSNGSLTDMLRGEPPRSVRVGVFSRLRREAMRVEAALTMQMLNKCKMFCSFTIEEREQLFKSFVLQMTVLEKYYVTMKNGGIEQKRVYHIDETYSDILEDQHEFPPEAASIGQETMIKLFINPMLENIDALCVPMRDMGMTVDDFAGLLMWILFDPDLPTFPNESRFKLDQARARVHNDWVEWYERRGYPDAHLRIARCLALLPIVNVIGERSRENFHLYRVFGLFEYDSILGEIFGFPKCGALPTTNLTRPITDDSPPPSRHISFTAL